MTYPNSAQNSKSYFQERIEICWKSISADHQSETHFFSELFNDALNNIEDTLKHFRTTSNRTIRWTKAQAVKKRSRLVNQWMAFLKSRAWKLQNIRITRLQELYLTQWPHHSPLHTSFGHIQAFNLRDLLVMNVAGNTFETFFTNGLHIQQICNCLSVLGKVCWILRNDYSFLRPLHKLEHKIGIDLFTLLNA
jgi:hypothetical protein